MKRVFIIGFIISIVLSGLVKISAESWTVKSVTGKVQYEVSRGNWKDIIVGQNISSDTLVNTSIYASLEVNSGEKNVLIRQMRKGTVEKLAETFSIRENAAFNQ